MNGTTIFETVAGSWLHGNPAPESDVDVRGVMIPPLGLLLHPRQNVNAVRPKDGSDRLIFSIGRFFSHLLNCRVEPVEMLFAPERFHAITTPHWEMIKDSREIFLSGNMLRESFGGYIFGQLRELDKEQRLLGKKFEVPLRNVYGLPDQPSVTEKWVRASASLPENLLNPDLVTMLRNEHDYLIACDEKKAFDRWHSRRTPKQKKIRELFGYDTKRAATIMRLLFEYREIVTTGHLTFPRPEASALTAIRNGKYSYEAFAQTLEGLESELDSLLEGTSLPKKPDQGAVIELYMKILENFFGIHVGDWK